MTPRIFITPEAKIRLDLYIAEAGGEISGLGAISQIGSDLLISEVLLLEQTCTVAGTIFDKSAYGRFLTSLVRQGKDPSLYRVWWHAHPISVGCCWSDRDEATINGFLGHSPWIVSIVGTKTGQYLARLDVYKPFWMPPLDNLPFLIYLPQSEEERASVRNEIEAKVKYAKYTEPRVVKTKKIRRLPWQK